MYMNRRACAHLHAAGGALEVSWGYFLIVLVIARRVEADAVPVEPVAAAVALQHRSLPIVGKFAQAVQLHRVLQKQRSNLQFVRSSRGS